MKGRSGGPRANSGGAREGAGRPLGVGDATLRPARLIPVEQKWAFADQALQHAEEAIECLVTLMRTAENENVRLGAVKEILNRGLGKAPQHVDITAMRHTEIVYQSAAQIRQEIAARVCRPPCSITYLPKTTSMSDVMQASSERTD
jgi:hypothetical protein